MYRAAKRRACFPKPRASPPKKCAAHKQKSPLSRGGPSRYAAPPKPRKQALKPEAERQPNRDRPIYRRPSPRAFAPNPARRTHVPHGLQAPRLLPQTPRISSKKRAAHKQKSPPLARGAIRCAVPPKLRKQALKPEAERQPNRDRPIYRRPSPRAFAPKLRAPHACTAPPASTAHSFPKPRTSPPKNARPTNKKAPSRARGPSRQAAPPKPRKQALKPEAKHQPNRERPI